MHDFFLRGVVVVVLMRSEETTNVELKLELERKKEYFSLKHMLVFETNCRLICKFNFWRSFLHLLSWKKKERIQHSPNILLCCLFGRASNDPFFFLFLILLNKFSPVWMEGSIPPPSSLHTWVSVYCHLLQCNANNSWWGWQKEPRQEKKKSSSPLTFTLAPLHISLSSQVAADKQVLLVGVPTKAHATSVLPPPPPSL